MAKISMFLSFFVFVLIVMPTSSSSRMMLDAGVDVGPVDLEIGTTKSYSCPAEDCSLLFSGCPPAGGGNLCPPLVCTNGVRKMCCGCGESCCDE
ncbi:hypothetical protein MKX01_029909 [Papaver californicum]|nr:hypothetical protein MKX01_029909 [Papaver californicum]